ncbi:hypothetical protein LN565_01015 [Xanthomonas euvesicatoria pv. euvesicatoria]|uniref:Uncharacterized protein n=6 Tax=Xanthomonas TaxID=338 RepID=A0AB73H274_9XANT|nr:MULTISPECIES: hypothetical protein [Xanthomonas]MBB5672256.1 hypothetical protein [Xanthomonas arboricola]MCC8501314.1 hypothetical protein [Xanthomonas euvesicatoria pv. euvesicatoria]MCC8569007.1 hypothetical protein [Xanthomonas euvesicatoria pv. euvesicatoria]MCC8575574.1 hypothetical protein [Xanthomonas euvesicatoria pv. euvesicatoria]MCC8577716.1 hypothetical protein [Xanthomonas euvesicatoria pv. euvesicatoria]
MSVRRMVRAPISASTRDDLRRNCNTTQAVVETAARASKILEPRDAYKEFRAAQDHFEVGCWLVYYRQQMAGEGAHEAIYECAELLRRHGLQEPTRNFETVFGFGIDCYWSVVASQPRGRGAGEVCQMQPEVRAC